MFDDAAGIRKEAGEVSFRVLRYGGGFESDRAFFSVASRSRRPGRSSSPPKLVEIRRLAGVEAPEFIYLNQLEQGVF